MFDSNTLTAEIKDYLAAEASFVEQVMLLGYRTVVEVGCGYGRYLHWALQRGYSYVGLDIVPWLIEIAQLRAVRAKSKYPDLKCEILRHPAEDIARTVKELSLNRPEQRAIVFFPFNCLGNVAQFDAVVDSLEASELDVIVSTFKTDAKATKTRKEYYGKCGFQDLNSRILKQGLLMVSEDGFHAMSYHQEFLANALRKRGFELKQQEQSVSVGCLFHFSYGTSGRLSGSVETETFGDSDTNPIEVSVYAIENDPLADDRKSHEPAGALLSFTEMKMSCSPMSADRIQGESSQPLPMGTMLRILLPVVTSPQATSEPSWHADLVGEVESCQPMGNSRYQLMVKLSKSLPGWLKPPSGFGNSGTDLTDESSPTRVSK